MNTKRPEPAGAPVLDPRITLATAVHSQPGVYALLIGSGTSTGAGIQTGWGVVRSLVAKAAAASGADVSDELDPEQWWAEHGDGQPLGYSGLLASLASTPAARRALLASFFEPTDEEREQGLKVPSAAHKAIAALVSRGNIRVIVTTNFDRLIEQALEAEGIFPQVIATAAAIRGMEPLAHARCTVIKLHGDYARIDQLNTTEELSAYDDDLKILLERVLDEYGLVINGWSADWDHALVEAIEGTRSRRYPLFWAARGKLGTAANKLASFHRAHVINGASADEFFPDLVSRLEALDSLSTPPLSKAMSLARLKRLLPDPTKHIELRDLFDNEISKIREYLSSRSPLAPSHDGLTVQNECGDIRSRCDVLLELLAYGVFLDRDRQHTSMWVWVIEQLMRARKRAQGSFNEYWDNLNHYPALLALKTVSLAAIAAGRDDVFLQAQREPTWQNEFRSESVEPAFVALHDYNVLDHDVINAFPRWDGNKWHFPRSRLLKDELRPIFLPLVGDERSYLQLYNRMEFRTALVQELESARTQYQASPGEFIGEGQWDRNGTLIWDIDFRATADKEIWEWANQLLGETGNFEQKLLDLSAGLARSRQR